MRVSAGANIGIGGGKVPVKESLREFGGAVIYVDIGVATIFRNRDLNRRCTAILPVIERVAMMEHRVIAVSKELTRSFQLLQSVRLEHNVNAELQITASTRNLPVNRLN